jgi:hypothetical protein
MEQKSKKCSRNSRVRRLLEFLVSCHPSGHSVDTYVLAQRSVVSAINNKYHGAGKRDRYAGYPCVRFSFILAVAGLIRSFVSSNWPVNNDNNNKNFGSFPYYTSKSKHQLLNSVPCHIVAIWLLDSRNKISVE